jgi:hypothetical protein
VIINAHFKYIIYSFLYDSRGDVNYMKCQIIGWNSSTHEPQDIYFILQFPKVDKWSS